jgi:hypothetical protein
MKRRRLAALVLLCALALAGMPVLPIAAQAPVPPGVAPAAPPPSGPLLLPILPTDSRVNDDAGTASHAGPKIAVGPKGNAYAIWMDFRNGDYDIYFTYRVPYRVFLPLTMRGN